MENSLLKNCIIVGIFTICVGFFTEKTLNKFNRKNNFLSRLKRSYPQFILTLFIFGIGFYLLLEYTGFEASCAKKCNEMNQCNYVCEVKMKDIFTLGQ